MKYLLRPSWKSPISTRQVRNHKIGQAQTGLPSGSNMHGLKSGSCRFLAANQILARTFFRSVAHPLACPAVGKFSRASFAGPPIFARSTALNGQQVSKNDTGCPFQRLDAAVLARIRLRAQPLESSLGRVPQAADGTCYKISQPGSCRSPRTV